MKVLLIGDSHTEHIHKYDNNTVTITTLKIGGATAQGLLNPRSSRNTLNKILKFFKKHNTNYFDYVLLCFGEVDCNSAIWFYKNKYNVSLDWQLDRSINNYEKFIHEYIECYFKSNQIILLTPILPNVSDDIYNEQRPSLRTEQFISHRDRTDLTFSFISKLKILSIKNNYSLISINDKLLDLKTNLIKDDFVNPSAHLPAKIAAKFWGDEIMNILEEKGAI
jgi:hypothetical protein